MNSHSIEQAAIIIVGADQDGKPLPGAVAWVERRLRRGEFSGYKAARRWRMTDADIAAAIESLRPQHADNTVPQPVDVDAPILLTSMTARSRRRMAVAR